MRWEWRERGSSLLCIYDPRGPAHPVIRPPKRLPASKISIAVRSDVPLDDTALIESL
jgi:hypothetical protein